MLKANIENVQYWVVVFVKTLAVSNDHYEMVCLFNIPLWLLFWINSVGIFKVFSQSKSRIFHCFKRRETPEKKYQKVWILWLALLSSAITCSKSTMEQPEKFELSVQVNIKDTTTTSVMWFWRRFTKTTSTILLTLNIFHTFFRCFHCWFWTNKYRLLSMVASKKFKNLLRSLQSIVIRDSRTITSSCHWCVQKQSVIYAMCVV